MAKTKKQRRPEKKVVKGRPRKEKVIEKIAKIDKRKEIELKKELEMQSRGFPFLYAAAILVLVAILGAVLIFSGPEKPVVKKGDTVLVQYTGELEDGTVFDSGNFTFTAGSGRVISGFDEAVTGMREGETKRFTLAPDKAYGEYNPQLLMDVPLTQELNRTVNTTMELFNLTMGEFPVLNKVYEVEGMSWPIKVVKIEDPYVIFTQEAEDGQVIHTSYGTSVVNVTEDKIKITLTPIIGGLVRTVAGNGRVVSENGTHMTLDFNHELAGKNLTFTVTVLKVVSG